MIGQAVKRIFRSPIFWASLAAVFFLSGPIWMYFTPGYLPFVMLVPMALSFAIALLVTLIDREASK